VVEYFGLKIRKKLDILGNKSGPLAQQVTILRQKRGKAWKIRGQTRQDQPLRGLKISKNRGTGALK
jgi:hypothetical protein